MDFFEMYFSFRDRIDRRMYWHTVIRIWAASTIAGMMVETANEKAVVLGYIIIFGLTWPALAIQTKRWHDRNKSGWWNLIILIPIVGAIWATIELGFLKGTPGENRYDLPLSTEDSTFAERIRESGTLRDGASVRNSWRDS